MSWGCQVSRSSSKQRLCHVYDDCDDDNDGSEDDCDDDDGEDDCDDDDDKYHEYDEYVDDDDCDDDDDIDNASVLMLV